MKNTLLTLSFLLFTSVTFAQTDSHTQAINKLMEVMHMEKQIEESSEKMFELQAQAMPQLTQYKDVMLGFFRKYINWKNIGDDVKNVYKELFTEQEIRDLIAFYQTETGQKVVKVTPTLTTSIARISQQVVMQHKAELQQTIMNARQQQN